MYLLAFLPPSPLSSSLSLSTLSLTLSQCKKGSKKDKNGQYGPLFVGDKCQHECPNSAEHECGGRGKCKQKSVVENSVTTFKAMCECDAGYFGAGCQKTCPGTNDVTAPGLGVCSGHGVCGNEDPLLTGHGVGKKCLCNEIGGWYPDKLTGGSSALSCPGADPHGAAKATTGTATKEYNKVCNGRGTGWRPLQLVPDSKFKGLFQNVPVSSRGCKVTGGEVGNCGCDLAKRGSNNAEARENNAAGPTSCAGANKRNTYFRTTGARRGNIFSAQQHCTCSHGDRSGLLALTPRNKGEVATRWAASSASELLRKRGNSPGKGTWNHPQCIDRGSIVSTPTWNKVYSPGATKPTGYFDSIRQCGSYGAHHYHVKKCWHESYFGGW